MGAFLKAPVAASANAALPLDQLTARERQVLDAIAGGVDNCAVDEAQQLSEKTVRNHITRIFDKIGVEHRYQAIVRAREAGLGMHGTHRSRTIIPDLSHVMIPIV